MSESTLDTLSAASALSHAELCKFMHIVRNDLK